MKEPFKGFYFLLAFLISSYSFKLAEYPYLVKTPFLLPASPSFKRNQDEIHRQTEFNQHL
jgi:hypothetical protein